MIATEALIKLCMTLIYIDLLDACFLLLLKLIGIDQLINKIYSLNRYFQAGMSLLGVLATAYPLNALTQPIIYSPYTKEQLAEFNLQPIAPAISVDEVDGQTNGRYTRTPSGYFQQPAGEEQAEVLGTESVQPYTPEKSAISF